MSKLNPMAVTLMTQTLAQAPNWDTALERIAKVAHNAHMADDWDDLPLGGIDRAIWVQVAIAVVKEIQTMMDEQKTPVEQ